MAGVLGGFGARDPFQVRKSRLDHGAALREQIDADRFPMPPFLAPDLRTGSQETCLLRGLPSAAQLKLTPWFILLPFSRHQLVFILHLALSALLDLEWRKN